MAIPKTSTSSRRIRASNLTPESFAPFGTVVQNPATHGSSPALAHVEANQGSATKWLEITDMRGFYELGASQKPARVAMNMFVCRPRQLRSAAAAASKRGNNNNPSATPSLFDVHILERHPFTPQTFIPLGLARADRSTKYLVIVAPTLPLRTRGQNESSDPPYPIPEPRRRRSLRERLLGARPNPFTNDFESRTTPAKLGRESPAQRPKGPGGPDLANLRAFVASGDQAVTYGPGTWHAPMVVLGEREVEFVVVQYANGVGVEDCQEMRIVPASEGAEGLVVEIEGLQGEGIELKAKL